MIFSIILFLIIDCASWNRVSGFTIADKNVDKTEYKLHDENVRYRRILDRSSSSTESSIRLAYETAMNQTISDYYAQRKAVMDRYYTRQREIDKKFRHRTTTPRIETTSISISTTTFPQIVDNGKIVDDREIDEKTTTSTIVDIDTNESEKSIESSNSLDHREDNWNAKDSKNATDFNFQSDLQANIRGHVDAANVPGYYKLGDFKLSEDEKIIYQHNLGVVPKGPSQLEATFDVVLEGDFAITAIEAFPYANTRADFSWISGGPGAKSIKLKLKSHEMEGFSYTIKVWGVPS